MSLNYRLLLPDEYGRLTSLFNGNPLPHPEASCIAVAEDEQGNIQGFLVLQLQWHMEPLSILDPRVNFLRLKETLDNQLREFPGSCYYALIDSEKVAKMAELAGLKPQPVLAFKGEVD